MSQAVIDGCVVVAIIILPNKQHQSGTPMVISGHLGVEAQHLRAATNQCRTIFKLGEHAVHKRPYRFAEEQTAQL